MDVWMADLAFTLAATDLRVDGVADLDRLAVLRLHVFLLRARISVTVISPLLNGSLTVMSGGALSYLTQLREVKQERHLSYMLRT